MHIFLTWKMIFFQNTNAESKTFGNINDFNHINVDNGVYDLDT